jgi:putative flippase GtrA
MASSYLFFKRLSRYALSSGLSVGIDFGLLFIFVHFFSWHYLGAATLSFTLGHSINYLVSRHFNFKHVDREHLLAYLLFVGFGLIMLGVTLILLGLTVSKFGWHYLVAKLVVGLIVGMLNFLFNYYITFKAHLVDFD